MRPATRYVALSGMLLLGACAVGPPAGPSVAVMPPSTKPIEVFQQDDAMCRQYALQANGFASPTAAANQSMANSAVLGTVLGAATGAAIGAATGNPAAGAAIGAGSGLLLGSAAGAGAANYSAGSVQYAYDVSYLQCMAPRGNHVPQLQQQYANGYGYGNGYGYPYGYGYPPPYYYGYPYFPFYFSGSFVYGGSSYHHY